MSRYREEVGPRAWAPRGKGREPEWVSEHRADEEHAEKARSAESAEEMDEAMRNLPEDVPADELQEFLAADALEVEADPFFRERLRRKLWAIVRERFGDDEDPAGGSGKRGPRFGPGGTHSPGRRDD